MEAAPCRWAHAVVPGESTGWSCTWGSSAKWEFCVPIQPVGGTVRRSKRIDAAQRGAARRGIEKRAMMNVRLYALVAALPLAATLGVAGGSAAHAAGSGNQPGTIGTCKLVVPGAVRVVEADEAIPVSVTGGCALRPGPQAEWYSSRGYGESIVFNNTKRSNWFMNDQAKLGFRTWYGEGASDPSTNDSYSTNKPITDVKVGSWAGLHGTKSGSTMTLNVRAVRYATSYHHTIPWAGEVGRVQYRQPGTSAWGLGPQVTIGSDGNASVKVSRIGVSDYRVVFDDQNYIWGVGSAPSCRADPTPRPHRLPALIAGSRWPHAGTAVTAADQLAALGPLLRRDGVLLFDPEGQTIIVGNLVGEWFQPDSTRGEPARLHPRGRCSSEL